MKTQSETRNLFEAREDTSDQVAVVFSFESDWFRGWRRFSGPITEQSKVYLYIKGTDTNFQYKRIML